MGANICFRERPLSAKERGEGTCIKIIDSECVTIKDEKEGDVMFSFDRIFYPQSVQDDVYTFLALPIVQNVVNGKSGTIITYGQTGAGKTYSMEGPSITSSDEKEKGLLPRVVDGLFDFINSSTESLKYKISLSMVEIYMEKIRDLYDLTNDNLKIKESKIQGILLPGVTEVSVSDPVKALQSISKGIANRAVGETQMNMSSSRSHCIYMFTIYKESDGNKRIRTGKLVLLDLAGSEKVDKTGAEGRNLEEAKTINKSLSALGNVINALTCSSPSKSNHIPYRDSKLTRILQDALGGYSQTALLCCCSPSFSNTAESLSTLRFGARAKYIKSSPQASHVEGKCIPKPNEVKLVRERILNQLRERLDMEDVVEAIEELFLVEGVFVVLESEEDTERALEDITRKTIFSLEQTVEGLHSTVEELVRENKSLGAKLKWEYNEYGVKSESFVHNIPFILALFISWAVVWILAKMLT